MKRNMKQKARINTIQNYKINIRLMIYKGLFILAQALLYL